MKALLSRAFGNLEDLELSDHALVDIGDDDVIINAVACGLNFPDLLILENKYQFKPELPFSPGGEVAGVVSRVGPNVTEFYLGQRVYVIERWGGLAEKIVVSKDRVYPLPDQIDMVSAASLVYNMSTALYALKNRGRAKCGETILIIGSGGGVGLAATQLSKALGLTVISAVGDEEKMELCRSFGADHIIKYTSENIKDRVRDITKNEGVNIVLDTVGGEYAELGVRSLAFGGRYLVVGFASGGIPKLPLNLVLLKGAEIMGVFWGKFSREEPHLQKENMEQVFDFFSAGKIKSYVGKLFVLEEAKQAIIDYKERRLSGKTVVICNTSLLEKDKTIVKPKETKSKFQVLSKEHLLESVGKDLGESGWVQITQAGIDDFANATGDHQWIHVNPKMAAFSPMGSTILHGFLVVSLAPKLLQSVYEMPFAKMGINYGVDRLRFLSPVKVNSLLKMKASLLEAEEIKKEGVKVRIGISFFVKGKDRPVCVAELLSIIY